MLKLFLTLFLYAIQISYLLAYYGQCTFLSSNSTLKIANTLNGQIRGECYTVPVSYSNNTKISTDVFSWLSIPYAVAPIGQNRFKRPIPVKNWTGIIDGTKLPNTCMQNSPPSSLASQMSEDCLYLNVFVRSDKLTNKMNSLSPVLIFIHGGDFTAGSSSESLYDPSTIVAMSGIIVVTINYRLDAFGFLRLEGSDATGNQAIHDQNLALAWVHDNAVTFGGDPNKVTINGESAGADSVGYHLLYPESWPYFRNAILQSGGPLYKGNF